MVDRICGKMPLDEKNMCEARIEYYCSSLIDDDYVCSFNTDEGGDPEKCDHVCGFKCICDEAIEEAYQGFMEKVANE